MSEKIIKEFEFEDATKLGEWLISLDPKKIRYMSVSQFHGEDGCDHVTKATLMETTLTDGSTVEDIILN